MVSINVFGSIKRRPSGNMCGKKNNLTFSSGKKMITVKTTSIIAVILFSQRRPGRLTAL